MSVGAEASERLALRALVDSYAQAVDGRDADRFAGLFAADGELVVFEPEEDEPSISWRGPDELREVMKLLSSYSTTFHLMANHTCELDGDSARAARSTAWRTTSPRRARRATTRSW